ncbi:MAG: hypothetical protein M5R38_07855 [Candidatus Methylomirabilis sp.]|nr:hypothetical protein [Candidatus Methylomirabilis sp.]
MSITFQLTSPVDLFEKLRREAARLDQGVSADNVFNFAVTAWHLYEWLKKKPGTWAPEQEADLDTIRKSEYLQICRDIANASKHYSLTYTPTAKDIVHVPGGIGRTKLGVSRLGKAKDTIDIKTDVGRYEIINLKNRVIELYEAFFREVPVN